MMLRRFSWVFVAVITGAVAVVAAVVGLSAMAADPEPHVVMTVTSDVAAPMKQARPGDTVTYTIELDNTQGGADAENQVVSLTIGSLTPTPASQPGWGTKAGNSVQSVPLDIPAGAKVPLSFTVLVPEDAKGMFEAEAYLEGSQNYCVHGDMAFPWCAQDPDPFTILNHPGVTMTKSSDVADGATVTAGDTITYTFSLANSGATTASGVQISDEFPQGFSFTGLDNTGWSTSEYQMGEVARYPTATRSLDVPPGQPTTVTLKVTATAATTSFRNVASFDATPRSRCEANPTGPTCAADPHAISITPAQSPSPTPSASPSGTTSPTPSATPTGTASPSPSATPTGTASPTPSATPTGTASPSPSATPTGTASPSPSPTPTQTGGPSPSPSPTESPEPMAKVSSRIIEARPSIPSYVGEQVAVVLEVTSDKSSTIPADIDASFLENSGQIRGAMCEKPFPVKLAPGESVICSGTYTVTATDMNNKSIGGRSWEQTPVVPGACPVTTPARPELAGLTLSMTSDQATLDPGNHLIYTLIVANPGPTAVTGVQVADALPDIATTGRSSNGWQLKDGYYLSDPFDLAPGATKTLTLGASVNMDATAEGQTWLPSGYLALVNVASIAGTAADGDQPGDHASCVADPNTVRVSTARLDHTITNDAPAPLKQVTAGQKLTYTITLTNTGKLTPAYGARIRLELGDVKADAADNPGWSTSRSTGGSGSTWYGPPVTVPAGKSVTQTFVTTVYDQQWGPGIARAYLAGSIASCSESDMIWAGCAQDEATPTMLLYPDVTLTKSNDAPSDGVITAGEIVTYTIKAANSGTEDLTKVPIKDTFPANFSFAGLDNPGWQTNDYVDSPWEDYPAAASTLVDIPARQSVTLTLKARATRPGAGPFQNLATVAPTVEQRCRLAPTGVGCGQDPKPITVRPAETGLILTKVNDLDGSAVQENRVFRYHLIVNNTTDAAMTGITVADQLPTGLVLEDNQDGAGDWKASGSAYVSDAFDLPAHTSKTLTLPVKVTQAAALGGTLRNVATTGGPGALPGCQADPATPGCAADPNPPSAGVPQLRYQIANDAPAPMKQVAPGGTVGYTVSVHNFGPVDAARARIEVRIPQGLAFDPASAPGWERQPDGALLSPPFDIGIGADKVFALAFPVTADATGILYTSAGAPGEYAICGPTDVLANYADCDSDPPTVLRHPDVQISKKSDRSGEELKNGDEVTYTITASNAGSEPVTGLRIVDTIPRHLTYQGLDNPGWKLTPLVYAEIHEPALAGQSIDLAPGESKELTLRLRVIDALVAFGPDRNVATFDDTFYTRCLTKPSGPACAVDPDPFTLDEGSMSHPALVLSKESSLLPDATVRAGSQYQYNFTVQNHDTVPVSGVQIVDQLPPGLEFFPAEQEGWTFADGVATSSPMTTYPSGDDVTASFSVRVASSALSGTVLRNTAAISGVADTASCLANPGKAGCASDPRPPVVAGGPVSVEIANDLQAATASLGTEFGYDVQVTHSGTGLQLLAHVAVRLPAGVSLLEPEGGPWAAAGSDVTSSVSLAAGETKTLHLRVKATGPAGLQRAVAAVTGMEWPLPEDDAGAASARMLRANAGTTTGIALAACVENPGQGGCAADELTITADATPQPTATETTTASPTPSASSSQSPTPSASSSQSPAASPAGTESPSPEPSESPSPSPSSSPSSSPTAPAGATATPSGASQVDGDEVPGTGSDQNAADGEGTGGTATDGTGASRTGSSSAGTGSGGSSSGTLPYTGFESGLLAFASAVLAGLGALVLFLRRSQARR